MQDDAVLSFDSRKEGLPEPIVWSDNHLVGVDIIDGEHHALIDLFNSILAVSKSHKHAELAILLEQLGNITASHFESEESLMAQFDYAHAAQHRIDHQKLLDEYAHQVDDWRNRYISAELLCRFMYRWLLRHVIASDMALGEAINRQIASGVNPTP
jgi:hemerythrin